MADTNWNPNEPFVLGMEWPGMRSLSFPLSQDVELGYTMQADATEAIDSVAFEIVPPSVETLAQATALVTVYRRDSASPDEGGDETEYGTVVTELCPVNGGTVSPPSSLVNAATLAEALVTPSDFRYVDVQSSTVELEFDTAGRFTGKRILEVKLLYSARNIAQPDAEAQIGLMLLRHAGSTSLVNVVDLDAGGDESNVREVGFGEVKYPTDGSLPRCWPWTPNDMELFDNGSTILRVASVAPGPTAFRLEYAALQVTWCEENRQAVAGLLLGSSTSGGEEPMQIGRHVALFRTPTGGDNWAKLLDQHYAITLTSARSPTHDRETKGTPPQIPAVDGFQVFRQHQGRVAQRLITNVLASPGVDSRVTPLKLVTTGGTIPTDFAPYDRTVAAPVFVGTHAAQDIEQRSQVGAIPYPWIRFYARIVGDPDDVPAIDISHSGGAGTMAFFAADLLALPEIFDGWREVTLRWPVGHVPSLDNSGTNFNFRFSTTQGSVQNRWEILGVDSFFLLADAPSNGNPTYGQGDTQAAYADPPAASVGRPYADLAVTVHSDPPAVTGFSVSVQSEPLAYNDDYCAGREPCGPEAFEFPRVNWDTSVLPADEFGHYEVQRQDTVDDVWRTIARLTAVADSQFDDHEARVGVQSSYRVRICRVDEICGAWSSTGTATPSAGDGGAGTMFFVTNRRLSLSPVVYPSVFEGESVESFEFVEAGRVQFQHMFGRDYTQSFHPTERGGVRFERTVLVNALVASEGRADHDFDLLRNIAWADVPYVCVKDDLGNRWYATLVVPNATIRRQRQIELAQVRVVESAVEPFPVSSQV